MKTFFLIIIAVHGLIHLLGFVKSIHPERVPQITHSISVFTGVLWLTATVLLLLTVYLFYTDAPAKVIIALAAVLLSQGLIISLWGETKFGTVPNIMILVVVGFSYTTSLIHSRYQSEVQQIFGMEQFTETILTEEKLLTLPSAIQKYIRISGAAGKAIPNSMKIVFNGRMRKKGGDWFSFTTEQYNSFTKPTRLFYMEGIMFGIPIPGYHAYKNGIARMEIKPLGLIPVVDLQSNDLNKGETVTVFNDLCLFAPGALALSNIRFTEIDSLRCKAEYRVAKITITAELVFNSTGELIDFVSDDRFETNDNQYYRFSTPNGKYRAQTNGMILGTEGSAIWHYPDGKFIYGEFALSSIEYNPELP